jgi:hypothetical protein
MEFSTKEKVIPILGLFHKKEKKPVYILSKNDLLVFYVQCEKCREVFRTVIRKNSELSQNFEEPNTYEIKKELIGSRCPNRINVYFLLNQGLKILKQTITGGKLITEEEFSQLKEE